MVQVLQANGLQAGTAIAYHRVEGKDRRSMTIRHSSKFSFLLALPVALWLPVYSQEVSSQAEPQQEPVQEQVQDQIQPPPAPRAPITAQRGGWQRFDEPDAVVRPAMPLHLTIPAGTWINLRVDQQLSSDHNRPGDAWSATLTQPVIVNGRVVAQPGQMVGGVVVEAEKAGRAKGTSRLGLDLNELTLADGRQIPVKSRLMEFRGPTSWGRDAVGVGTTVATGAAIGGAVNGGVGAGVGAAAGVVASTVGVLLTRGKPTVVYPETTMTFRLEAPFTFAIDNEASLRAFGAVQANDYRQQPALRSRVVQQAPPAPGYYAPYPYYSPYYSPYYYSPYFYGPSVGLYFGSGWGYGGWGRGGFRR
jgi:hypothetical protein